MSPIKLSFLLLLLVCRQAQAAPTDRYEELTGEEDDFKVVEKPWKEHRGKVPPLPAEDQWSPVRLDELPEGQQAYIDLHSLTIGEKDEVVRYWLSIRSKGGGNMTDYEGLHCGKREFIIYAWGNARREPAVREVREAKWRPVREEVRSPWRWELMKDVLCSGEVPRTPRQIAESAAGRYELNNPFDNWTNDD